MSLTALERETLRHCAYHCRGCDGCFTSLAAFDAHRSGPFSDRRCDLSRDFEEHWGTCKVSEADGATGQPISRMVRVYSLRTSESERERLRGLATRNASDGARADPRRLKSAA
jgi:hypothetical protein